MPTPPPTTSNNSKRYLSSVQLFLQHPPNSHNDNDIDDVDEDEENEEGMGLVVDGQHHGTHHDTTSNDTQQQSLSIYNGDLDPHYNNDNNHSNNINETDDPSADVSSSASTTSSSLRVYDTTHDYDDEIISQCSSNAETKHVQYWMEDDAMLLYNHQQHRQHQRQNAIPPPVNWNCHLVETLAGKQCHRSIKMTRSKPSTWKWTLLVNDVAVLLTTLFNDSS